MNKDNFSSFYNYCVRDKKCSLKIDKHVFTASNNYSATAVLPALVVV